MEQFTKLPWRIEKPSDLEVVTDFITEENIGQSFVYNGNFPENNELDTEKVNNSPKYNKDYKPTFKSNLKHYSQLTRTQHSQCLQALQLLQTGRSLNTFNKKEQQLINIYNNLLYDINKEHKLFLQFVEKQWQEKMHFRTNYLITRLYNFGLNKRKQKLANVKKYPQFYKCKGVIPLAKHQNIIVSPEICTLQLGSVGHLFLPYLDRNRHMNINNLPSENINKCLEEYLFVTKLSVSEDTHAEYLATKTDCNIVISSSSLKTITDNFGPDFNSDWVIPIVIKEHVINENKVNIVYIDKPFPQRHITVTDLKYNVYKVLLKTNMCRKTIHNFATPQIIIDNFNSKSQMKTNFNETDEHSSAKRQKLDDNAKTTEVNTDKTYSKYLNQRSPVRIRKGHLAINQNVSYTVWNMQSSGDQNALLKNNVEQKKIKVLIRTKTDAYKTLKSGKFLSVNLIPKLEFQWEYGGEIMSKSELLRQWTTLFFRPFSNLYRIRTNADSHIYLKIEQLNLNSVHTECLKQHSFAPKDNLNILFNIFAEMTNIEPGKYLLHHTPKQGPFVALMENCEKTLDSFNLYDYYDESNCTIQKESQWMPIDKNVILPMHVEEDITPGIFPPKKFDAKLKRKFSRNYRNYYSDSDDSE